jgi:hypothetical protein
VRRAILVRVSDDDLLHFGCPRCGSSTEARYYGPCTACRQALRTVLRGEARAVEGTAFEPAMHVTPNAVALKE